MQQDSDYIKGFEVLSFDHAELNKTEEGTTSFVTVGTLSVLYFREYQRFILWLNDTWDFALTKKNHISASSRSDMKTRTYKFPSSDGVYILKLSKISHPEAIQNFDSVLKYGSNLYYEGEEKPGYDSDSFSQTSLEDVDSFLENYEKQEGAVKKLRGGDRIKRRFARISDKISGIFTRENKNNPNLTQRRDIKSIQDVNEEVLHAFEFSKKEVQNSIISSREVSKRPLEGSNNTIYSSQDVETVKTASTVETVSTYKTKMNENEFAILNNIEVQQQIQEEARRIQEEQKRQELELLEKERKLRELLKKKQEEKLVMEIKRHEETLISEVQQKEATLEDLQERIVLERQAFEQKEDLLKSEIEAKLAELRLRDKLSEEERLEFQRKESELIRINELKEVERQELIQRHTDLIEQTKLRNAQASEKEKMAQVQQMETQQIEARLRAEAEERLNELKEKQRLAEQERLELKLKEEELMRATELTQAEKLRLENEKREIEAQAEQRLAEIQAKEELTKAERQELSRREGEFVKEIERKLNEINEKEKSNEAEVLEIRAKQLMLGQMAASTVVEREDLEVRQAIFAQEVNQREAELREKERLVEEERLRVQKARAEQQAQVQVAEETRELINTLKQKIIEMKEQRSAELREKEQMTEAQEMDLHRREHELQLEVERKLAEIREKEQLTEQERLDVQQREETLISLAKMGHDEDVKMMHMLQKLKAHEALLIEKNKQLMMEQLEINKEIKDLQEDAQKPTKIETAYHKYEREEVQRRSDTKAQYGNTGEGVQIASTFETTTSG